MKLLKPKFPPKAENRFQEFLRSQPVYNWFDRYEKKSSAAVDTLAQSVDDSESWLTKRAG